MKDRLDAARLKLASIEKALPQREIDRIISQLARDLTGDELGDLISAALREQYHAKAAFRRAEQQLDALVKARHTQRTREKSQTHMEE